MKSHLALRSLAGHLVLAAFALCFFVFAAPRASAVAPADGSVFLRLDLDRPVIPADSPEKIIVKVCLDGLRLDRHDKRQPVNLALVIDRSGSMTGDKIAKAREAALEVVRRLGPDDIFSLIAYDSRVETLIHARHVQHHSDLEEVIDSIRAGGSTALHGGVCAGAEEVRHHLSARGFIHRVILLSDGEANVGPQSTDALARLGRSLGREGIPVTTVGLGMGFNEDLMASLAQTSDGNTYFARHSSDLPRIFQSELGDARCVIARRVVVEIEFPDGVRPVRFVGREGRIDGNRASLEIGHLYGGQQKFALIEAEVAAGKHGSHRPAAKARARFEDLDGRKYDDLVASGSLSYSSDFAEVKSRSNAQVQADYAANIIALAKEDAIRLADANRTAEAAARIKKDAAALQVYGASYSNSAVLGFAKQARECLPLFNSNSLAPGARKELRADAAQTKNQQSEK